MDNFKIGINKGAYLMEDLNKEDWGFTIKSWPDTLLLSEPTEEENEVFLLTRLNEDIIRPLDFN